MALAQQGAEHSCPTAACSGKSPFSFVTPGRGQSTTSIRNDVSPRVITSPSFTDATERSPASKAPVSAGSAAVVQYLRAAQLMDESLIPGAQKVDEINRNELNRSYESVGRISLFQRVLVWLTGLGMLAILLRAQFYLSNRMRRTFNPLCLVATALTAGLLLYTNQVLSTASHEIDVVKADAFESVHLLWKTKATAYGANAKESRFLLDKQGAASHLATFDALTSAISSDPAKLVNINGQSQART